MTSASLSAPAASSELALTTIIPTFTTDSPQGESPEFKTLKLFLYFTILAFSSLGNGLVFLLISCNRRLRQGSSNRLLLNLSACDFLTPLLGIPFDLVLEERGYVWPYGEFMCHALWPASTFTATASALTLAAISLDRFRLLMNPFIPRLTKKQIKFVIISVHMLSLVIIIPYVSFLKLEDHECIEQWPQLGYRQAYTLVLFLAQYALPLVFMTTMYTIALVKLYNVTSNTSQMRMKSQHPRTVSANRRKISVSSQFSETNNNAAGNGKKNPIRKLSSRVAYTMSRGFDAESNVRVTKMFIVIVAIFAIFMLPNQIVWLWMDFGAGNDHIRLNVIKIVCWLFTYTNCVCNPVIFVIFCKEFRTEILIFPRRLLRKPKQRLSISRSSVPAADLERRRCELRRLSPTASL